MDLFSNPKLLGFSKKGWPRRCRQTGIKHCAYMSEDRVIPGTTLTYGEQLKYANAGATPSGVGEIMGLTHFEIKFSPWETQKLEGREDALRRCVRTQRRFEANLP